MTPHLDPARSTWHITFGTYGTRLHGDDRPTVDRQHNQRHQSFIDVQPSLKLKNQNDMRAEPVILSIDKQLFVQQIALKICQRGQWHLHIIAAAGNHVHTLLDAQSSAPPKDIRKWFKRWLGDALTDQFGKPAGDTWWAEGGSTKPVKDQAYFDNVYRYILRQKAT